jgi:hypothetical protein
MSGSGSDGIKSREELTRIADEARVRLMHTLDELEQRGRSTLDMRRQVRSHARTVVIGASILLVGAGFGLAWAVQRVSTAAERRWRDRWRLLRSGWRYPNRVRRSARGPLVVEAARSIVLSLLTAAIVTPGKRLITDLSSSARGEPPSNRANQETKGAP